MNENPFVGAWRLVSLESRTSDGIVGHPWGRDPKGYFIFSADGHVSVAVMSAKRPRFVSGDLLGGTKEEKAAAAETYLSYVGRYEVRGNKLTVHFEVSLFPNWVGKDQERFFEFHGNRFTLSTPPILIKGKKVTTHGIWERASENSQV